MSTEYAKNVAHLHLRDMDEAPRVTNLHRDSAIRYLLRELAEREATPPVPAPVRGEPEVGADPLTIPRWLYSWAKAACFIAAEHDPKGGHDVTAARLDHFARVEPVSTPTPAPDQPEGAVEAWVAMQDAISEAGYHVGPSAARTVLAALDRGAIPGYGPTGASGGAGEVR